MIASMLLLIFIAGLLGGAVNALITDNGFIFPQSATTADGVKILRPGFIGNMFAGGVAAMISWGLYGPLSAVIIVGTKAASSGTAAATTNAVGLSLASLVGALLVGVGGARWLSNEVDKNLLRAAAADAAGKGASDATSKKIALASPTEALNLAKTMQ